MQDLSSLVAHEFKNYKKKKKDRCQDAIPTSDGSRAEQVNTERLRGNVLGLQSMHQDEQEAPGDLFHPNHLRIF